MQDLYATDDARSDVLYRSSSCLMDHEERRMSDLSDFCWSTASSVDNQLSSLAADQQLYNLQNECVKKDATIKELAAAAHISSTADAKRITELQEVLKRKNMVISKLRKDMAALKQMVIELSRAKRAPSVNLTPDYSDLPVMSNNILYDMSSTSSSSSDSESPVAVRENLFEHIVVDGTPKDCQSKGSCRVPVEKSSRTTKESSVCMLRSINPLKEIRINPKVETNSVDRQKQQTSSNGEFKRTRRQNQHDSRNKAIRRWL